MMTPDEHWERAVSTFAQALEDIVGQLAEADVELREEHLDEISRTTVYLASSMVPELEDMLTRIGNGEFDCGERNPQQVVRATEDRKHWYEGGGFQMAIPAKGKPFIRIGAEGEARDDEAYLKGMTAEVAHKVINTVVGCRSKDGGLCSSVDEFYDISFTLKRRNRDPERDVLGYMLADFFLENSSSHEFIKRLYCGDGILWMQAKDYSGMSLPRDETMEVLGWKVNQSSAHREADRIAWKLLKPVAELKGCEPEEAVSYLPVIAAKTMYDDDVDFSSPDAFVESVTARLDEYLA